MTLIHAMLSTRVAKPWSMEWNDLTSSVRVTSGSCIPGDRRSTNAAFCDRSVIPPARYHNPSGVVVVLMLDAKVERDEQIETRNCLVDPTKRYRTAWSLQCASGRSSLVLEAKRWNPSRRGQKSIETVCRTPAKDDHGVLLRLEPLRLITF